ncbi:MAG: PAS domain-containing sensor histidine kinase [Microscillaceae bacterium]|nr:PAS domain-containing sensor histidine kinase [Microscillaceae bacterium]
MENKINTLTLNSDLPSTTAQIEEIVRQKSQIQSLLDSSVQLYILVDADYKVLIFNQVAQNQARELFRKEIQINELIFEYLPFTANDDFKEGFSQALAGQKISNDFQFKQKYVGTIWYNVHFLPIFDENNQVWAVGFSMLDITHRHRIQEQLHRKNTQLEQKNQELAQVAQVKDKLFSIIAHDFRAPLGVFKGVLPLLEDDGLTSEERKYVIDDLYRKVDNTLQAMDNLLYWAKSQLQGIDLKINSLNLHNTVQEIIHFLEHQAKSKSIVVENLVAENQEILADPASLQIIIRNLIANAIKFTNEGKISVQILDYEADTNFWQISVQDNGVGIAPENLGKIFEAESYTTAGTAQEKGTGIGLSVCKEFVERHGGKIWVESVENVGSTFSFTLPKA